MRYISLITGIILGLIGLYKIDIVLIAGLNYFGKYVFFGLFHLFIIYLYYLSYKKNYYLSLLIGLFLFILGLIIGM